ncbi:MAG: FAD-dependent oxidoreductase, partial [Candidatus Electrothrix sp. AW5]|nr:FAD-dependent oxidoreductase [Candidatus Electrothrix gigas]
MTKKILVMGGGIAGLTAAIEATKAGYEVTIVEKTDKLGGKALGWRKMFPTSYPYSELEEPNIEQMIAEATSNSKITIKTETEVARSNQFCIRIGLCIDLETRIGVFHLALIDLILLINSYLGRRIP